MGRIIGGNNMSVKKPKLNRPSTDAVRAPHNCYTTQETIETTRGVWTYGENDARCVIEKVEGKAKIWDQKVFFR